MVSFVKNNNRDRVKPISSLNEGECFLANKEVFMKTKSFIYNRGGEKIYNCLLISQFDGGVVTNSLTTFSSISLGERLDVDLNVVDVKSNKKQLDALSSGTCFDFKDIQPLMKIYYRGASLYIDLHTGELFEINPDYVPEYTFNIVFKERE